MTPKQKLLNDIKEGMTNGSVTLSVDIVIPDMPRKETVINHRDNFLVKHDYYEKAYDDSLRLLTNSEIRIASYRIGTNYVEVPE
ncbi:hypothetical protein [Lactococcus sp. DD01]|uniref:hypothetical protein n=1 Tax=Lactococcus sp. DD01 TaxID=1776443 RepID=UPI000776456D|nr:hypothetical protein [Lactococcus sp. DD01]KXT61461.1 hypothetical protein LACDD01_01409 [Lactococcus sp. DD01]